MQSIDLIRQNLTSSEARVLARVEDMQDHCLVAPTPQGGGHTLWVLGHLAYIEGLVIRKFMLGDKNPLAAWENTFDGSDVSSDSRNFPAFEHVLTTCREMRQWTVAKIDTMVEEDLDEVSTNTPQGYEDTFGTFRLCLQYVSDHWYMHRGQLAGARRAAGLARMWV